MAELATKVYSEALFDAAKELNGIDQMAAEYKIFVETITEDSSVLEVLSLPSLKKEEKKRIVKALGFGKIFTNFLCVLIDKDRIGQIVQIKIALDKLINAYKGIETAYVKTALALNKTQIDKLKDSLRQSTGKTIEIVEQVDESLIGGMTITIGDTVLDGSVKHRLSLLLNNMTSAVIE